MNFIQVEGGVGITLNALIKALTDLDKSARQWRMGI
jgi:hypothetical protein